MNDFGFLGILQSYLSKKHASRSQISYITSEYRRQIRKRRRAMLIRDILVSYLHILADTPLNTHPRVTWSYAKSGQWWMEIVPVMDAKQFKENFRLNRNTFSQLVDELRPHLHKNDTIFRSAISVEKRVACSLYLLGSTCELRTAAHLFGIGKSTAASVLHEFCNILVDLYFHRFIKFPSTSQEIQQTIDEFFQKHQYPVCLGAVDGSHISVRPPLGAETDYFNYKKHHSVILLAVVNSILKFTYINIGAPGRCNDASVYNRSMLAEVIQNRIYAQHHIIVNNTKIQSHLIADSAFALSRTLLKPFPERTHMPAAQSLFNFRLSHCRSTVERAFGSLKNRFRCLHKKMEYDIENVKTMVKAACILHNLCIDAEDIVEIEWDIIEPVYKKPACNIQMGGTAGIRESLSIFFLHNPL